MKFTYQWLKDFVDIKITPEKLADALTMAGLEVGGFERHGDDAVYEIEITSNRPDWLSVIGVAREVAALTGGKCKVPPMAGKTVRASRAHATAISIEQEKDCPMYSAAVIRGVKVGPSPAWLKERLERIGCRSINNVVDITNYVMFEMGEPLHAFDLAKLGANRISVRRAKQGETLTVIDGKTLALSPDVLLITNGMLPVALAGVMGGKQSEVDETTCDVLLEAAIFNPILIRKARQKFGLQTDSSYRFERGVAPETALAASSRARELILQLAGGREESFSAVGKKHSAPVRLKISTKEVSQFMGVEVRDSQVHHSLSSLGFVLKKAGKGVFTVDVPAFRQDAKAPIDLIEEVLRIYGFENVPSTLASIPSRPQAPGMRDFIATCKHILQGLGISEAVTLSLVDRGMLTSAGYSADEAVAIANPLSREQEVMRPTLVPSLLSCVRTNFNRQEPCVCLFEIAHTYRSRGAHPPQETVTLAVALSGTRATLLGQGQVRDQLGLLHVKGALLELLQRLGVPDVSLAAVAGGFEVRSSQTALGIMRLIPKRTLEQLDIKNRDVAIAEIDLDAAFGLRRKDVHFIRPPQFPAITRDVSFSVKEEVRTSAILEAVAGLKLDLLEEARVIDVYKGKQLPQGCKGLVISCVYRSTERTLTENEVQPQHSAVVQLLQSSFGAGMR